MRIPLRGFSQSLPMALLRAREAVMSQFRPALRHYQVTEQQWRVLRALDASAAIETTRLAQETFLLAPSLSRILKDLERRSLIRRRVSPADLRLALVSISPRGKRLIATAGSQSEMIYDAISRKFGPRKLLRLQSMLADLERDLGRTLASPGSGKRMKRAIRPRKAKRTHASR